MRWCDIVCMWRENFHIKKNSPLRLCKKIIFIFQFIRWFCRTKNKIFISLIVSCVSDSSSWKINFYSFIFLCYLKWKRREIFLVFQYCNLSDHILYKVLCVYDQLSTSLEWTKKHFSNRKFYCSFNYLTYELTQEKINIFKKNFN